jgi:hypothetical protein
MKMKGHLGHLEQKIPCCGKTTSKVLPWFNYIMILSFNVLKLLRKNQ